jgi:uncharacterized protein YjbI with pentapeptide repeats
LADAPQVLAVQGTARTIVAVDADLSGSTFSDVALRGAAFRGANLSGVVIDNAKMVGVSIKDADLSGAVIENVKMVEAGIKDANLSGCTIAQCSMDGMTIDGVAVSELFAAWRLSKGQ